jgi:hypothetical protein
MTSTLRSIGLNPLLVKHEVGRAKESTYDLPPIDFAYGHSQAKDSEGARELVHEWRFHKAQNKIQSRVPDFRRINREAIKEHVHDARQLAAFRQDHPWKLKTPRERKLAGRAQEDARARAAADAMHDKFHAELAGVVPSSDQSFGVKVRPSTPVNSIIQNYFGAEYETKQRGVYQEFKLQRERAGEKIKIRTTKAAKGHTFKPPAVVSHEKFIMSRFKNVKGKMGFAAMFGMKPPRPKEVVVGEPKEVVIVGEP